MKAQAWLLLPSSAIVADAAVIGNGFAHARGLREILSTVVAHLAIDVVYGLLLRVALARMGQGSSGMRIATLGTAVAFFVPTIGSAALVAALYTLIATKPKVEQALHARYAPPRALDRRPPTELRRGILADRLVYLARDGQTIDTRFRAVLQSNDAPAVVAVPVLKAALADAAEEVRLSAFSQLEKKRRGIDLRIERAREVLKEDLAPARAKTVHASLAEDYYEIAYLGLAEGEVYKHTLKAALGHAREALALVPDDAPTLRLVGRIRMRQSPPDEPAADAKEAFDAAAAAGMPASELASDYAEEAFRRRAFTEVTQVLGAVVEVAHDHVVLAKVQEFWRWQ